MNVVNLTGHPVRLYDWDDLRAPFIEYPPAGPAVVPLVIEHDADVLDDPNAADEVMVTPLTVQPADLPDPQPGTVYLVTRDTALTTRGRTDLLVPWIEVRDETGVVIGHGALQRITH